MSEEGPRWLPENPARAIYGQILVTSLVGALSEDEEIDSVYILVSVVTTMLIFWLAHVYAETMSRGLEERRHLGSAEIRRLMAGEWPLVQAAFPTAIVLALGAIGVFSRDTAVDLAIGVGVLALFLWGLAIGRLASSSWPVALLGAVISGCFGLVVVGLKAIIH